MNSKKRRTCSTKVLRMVALPALAIFAGSAVAQESSSPPPPLSSDIDNDLPPIVWLDKFQRSNGEDYMLALGKAFFWDQQVGSDGQACASCHSVAGGDQRSKNQLSPGLLAGDSIFDATATGGGGPNYQLRKKDFPLHQKFDPKDRSTGSNVKFDTNDVVSSMGVHNLVFDSVDPVNHTINDNCSPGAADSFGDSRRVEPRHTPTVINAALNFDNFWDGRANNVFNAGVHGRREEVTVFQIDKTTNTIQSGILEDLVPVRIDNASLASQAVGPIESDFEMSCAGRDAADIGEKLVDKIPLYFQEVHANDSTLGQFLNTSGHVKYKYRELIEKAFKSRWWKSNDLVDLNGRQYEMIEANFPIFFGISVMMYERTLVSNESRYDQYHRGDDGAEFTDSELNGQDVFLDKGKCVNCHATAAFTKASTLHLIDEDEEEGLVERMLMGDESRGPALYDNGWYNIGVTRTNDDISRGADAFGDPLSFTRQYIDMLRGRDAPDPFEIDECKFEIRFDGTVFPGMLETIYCDDGTNALRPTVPLVEGDAQDIAIRDQRVAVDGAQKVSSLRNLSVQGPYFHNGGSMNLKQVIEFYNRGGNFFHENQSDIDPDIRFLDLTKQEMKDLEAFLRTLDDDRVLDESGPFDRPQLFIPTDGTVTGQQMEDCMLGIAACTGIQIQPATGENGRSAEGLPSLKEFEDTLPY